MNFSFIIESSIEEFQFPFIISSKNIKSIQYEPKTKPFLNMVIYFHPNMDIIYFQLQVINDLHTQLIPIRILLILFLLLLEFLAQFANILDRELLDLLYPFLKVIFENPLRLFQTIENNEQIVDHQFTRLTRYISPWNLHLDLLDLRKLDSKRDP